VKTQYNAICTPPLIASLSPNVSGYTSNSWGGNLVGSVDLASPKVACDAQESQVDGYTYDGASGTVPDQTELPTKLGPLPPTMALAGHWIACSVNENPASRTTTAMTALLLPYGRLPCRTLRGKPQVAQRTDEAAQSQQSGHQ